MNQPTGDRQVAVLIDDENVGLGSVEWLFDQVSNLGRILVRRAYADWSKGGGQRDQLLSLGIEPIHVFQASSSGKNASDIRLVMDAIDLLFSSPVDTFVIVSGDADFLPLVNKLRSSGKMVVGAGRKKATSATLVKACDRYFYLDEHEEKATAAKRQPREPGKSNLLVRAVQSSMDADGKVIGSQLHQTMQRLDPGFDFRAQGFNSFRAFLEAASEVNLSRPSGQGQGDVVIELRRGGQDSSSRREPQPSPPVSPPIVSSSSSPSLASESIESKIEMAWSKRASTSGKSIPGAVAAGGAARVLGVEKLSDSEYKNLQGLLDAIPYLAKNWRRDGNKIFRN
jgi:uncharacterized protein (TIGR00288 family)